MKCRAVRKEIEELEVGQALGSETGTHLLACGSCRRFSDERAALRMLLGGLEEVSAPPDFDWRLRARLIEARSESPARRRWLAGFAPGTQALALAASFVFLIAGVVVYRQMRPLAASDQKGPQPSAAVEEKAKAPAETVQPARVTLASQAPDVTTPSDGKTESNSRATQRARPILKNSRASIARAETGKPAPATERVFSNDFGSRPAEELSAGGLTNSFTSTGPVFPVPVRSNKTTDLQFEDGAGMKRSLAPIIFGAQESIERKDGVRLVSTSNKGVW